MNLFEPDPLSPQARAQWVPQRTPEQQAEIERTAADLRALAAMNETADVVHVWASRDGRHVMYAPAPPMQGPQLPTVADVWKAQAAQQAAMLNGTDEDFTRAINECSQTEEAFNAKHDAQLARDIEALEAGT